MMRTFLVLIAGMMLASCTTTPVQNNNDHFNEILSTFIQKHNIPGGSIAVSKNGKIIHASAAGFADVEHKTSVTPSTQFRIASATKPITAVAVFQILEKSGTNLETALNKPVFGSKGYLPEYKTIKDKRVYKITLRDLLQHTGGWDSQKEGYDPQYDVYHIAKKMKVAPPADAKTVIRYVLANRKLDVDPGKEYHYSNFGYNLLGRIIEKLSGETYEGYVQNHIFQPLGITDMQIAGNHLADRLPNETYYYDDPRAPLTTSVFDNKTKGPMAYNGFVMHTMDAHGGFLGTPKDLLLILHGVTPQFGGVQLLKPEMIEALTAPVTNIHNPTASLGWVSKENGQDISHAGALETGTLSYYVRRKDGYAWAVTFNRLPVKDLAELGPIAEELMNTVNGNFNSPTPAF